MAKITVNAPPNYSLCLVPKAERGRHKVLSGSTATLRFPIFSSPVGYLTYPTTLRPFLMVSYFLTYLYPNADSPCIVLRIYPSQLRLAVPGFRDFMSQSDSDSMPSYFKLTTCFPVHTTQVLALCTPRIITRIHPKLYKPLSQQTNTE